MTPIKRLMLRHGLTVADLAVISGKSHRIIEYWRSGDWPAPRYILIILAALNEDKIDMDWLSKQIR
jgi:hypothetical protein